MATFHVLLLLLSVCSAAARGRLRTFHITENKDLTQSEAQAACRRTYTDLVTVYSEEENTMLANLTHMAGINGAFIGLFHSKTSNKWSNGDAVTFKGTTENCGTGSFCASMVANGNWDYVQCTEKRSFMCYKQGTQLSYNLVLEKMAWYDAQRYCREHYTDLVSIRDQKQNEEVQLKGKNSNAPFWIGLLCDDWEWADGGLSAYRNWGTNQPRLPGHYVKIMGEKWQTTPCNNHQYALCYHNNFTVFSAAARGRLRTFHIIGNGNLTQTEARTACRRTYTNLVTVYSEEENTVLANLTEMVYPSTAWIGLYHSKPSYKWSNGDAATFRNLTGMKVCETESYCVTMKDDGGWDTLECTEEKDFMCYTYDANIYMPSYNLILKKMAWYDAQRYCREHHTDLVSIRDQKQNEEVHLKGKNSSAPFWIGLLCDDWEWADGGLSAYRNWGFDHSRPFNCVKLIKNEWTAATCTELSSALCYSTSIHVSNDSMSWERALDYCKEGKRTGLLRIESDLDQNEVESELRRNNVSGPVWVGLRQSRLFGFWIWSNGMAVSHWHGGGQPEHHLSHHCGAVESKEQGFKWHDKDCRSEFRVLCEVK